MNVQCFNLNLTFVQCRLFFKHYNESILLFFKNSGELLVVGGCRQHNNYNLNIEASDRKAILERCYKICPELKVMLHSLIVIKFFFNYTVRYIFDTHFYLT